MATWVYCLNVLLVLSGLDRPDQLSPPFHHNAAYSRLPRLHLLVQMTKGRRLSFLLMRWEVWLGLLLRYLICQRTSTEMLLCSNLDFGPPRLFHFLEEGIRSSNLLGFNSGKEEEGIRSSNLLGFNSGKEEEGIRSSNLLDFNSGKEGICPCGTYD